MKKHKSEKIHEVVNKNYKDLNLHEIKAKTGAGNGYKHHNNTYESPPIKDTFINTNKFDKIYKVVTNIEGKANLHKIKAQTGAGNGYISNHNLENNIDTPSADYNSYQYHSDSAHKSHKIHAIFHEYDRKLNLHEIKRKTGAGSGYKHQ